MRLLGLAVAGRRARRRTCTGDGELEGTSHNYATGEDAASAGRLHSYASRARAAVSVVGVCRWIDFSAITGGVWSFLTEADDGRR